LSSGSFAVDPAGLAYKLTLSVLIPTVSGILIRRYLPCIKGVTKKFKVHLGMVSSLALVTIVWMTLSRARGIILKQNVGEIFLIFAVNIIIHVFYLTYNYVILRYLCVTRIELRQTISVVIMASQKSSAFALSVISSVTPLPTERGLLVIPCILGTLVQVFLGAIVSRKFAAMMEESCEDDDALVENENRGKSEGATDIVINLDSCEPCCSSAASSLYAEIIEQELS